MVFHKFDDPRQFVEQVNPFLMANEAENNLMISIVDRLADPETAAWFTEDHSRLFSCVLDGPQVMGAAVMTPPHKLVLTPAPEPAIALLAERLHHGGTSLPGSLGPKEPVEAFAAHWQLMTGQSAELEKSLRAFQLTSVIPVPGVSGRARRATEDDLDLIHDWRAAFAVETGTIAEQQERALQHISAGSIWLWTDPGPVAMATAGSGTPNGTRVGGVYTPPNRRCHGYASALVAEVSQSILDSGKQFCFLFTNLANPISNSIYAKIGYKPVSDYADYRFRAVGEA